jgi:tetratricopeptide (TPR) repeat protein
MTAQEATPNNLLLVRCTVVCAVWVCCQLFSAVGLLNNAVYAHVSKHSHTNSTQSSKTKSKHHKCVAHKSAGLHKTARNNEPLMPAGYHEASGLMLKVYQLHKAAWNDAVQKNYDAAATNLHQAITLTGQSYGESSKLLLPLYLDLASVEQEAKHSNQTAAALTACLKLDPTYVDASIKLALTRLQQGNTSEAMTAGKQALKDAPQDPRTHVLMSLLLSKAGQSSQATQEKIEARKLYQSMPQIKTLPANMTSGSQTEQTAPNAAPTASQGTQSESQPSADRDNDEQDTELELP